VLHILIVDDNPSDRLLIIRELEREFSGFQVTEILDATAFTEALATESFDIAIIDYQLRWSNGLEVLRGVKSRFPDCPVIMFTNTGNEEIAVEAMKAGLDDYIIKSPRHYVRLAVAVQGVLKRVAAQKQVVRLENRLQSLLDRLNVGVFSSTVDGRLLESNQAFLRLLGLENLQQAQAIDLRDLFWISLDSQQVTAQAREISLPKANGLLKWVLLTQYFNTTTEGETVIDGLLEDITSLKQAEIALLQLNETLEIRVSDRTAELEDVNAQLEAFAYSVSHDLRAPLRAIESFAQILLTDYSSVLDATGEDFLQRIEGSAALMNTLIENLLDYSRLSRSNLPIAPVNLSLIVSEAYTQLGEEIRSKKAIITFEPLPSVLGHSATLLRVLVNLLSNALKFVAPGVEPRIRVWAQEVEEAPKRREIPPRSVPETETARVESDTRNKWIHLWVEDNGIGIAPDYHQRIFGVFERLHGVEVYPGTGIGLAIARKGVERMGGRIGVESALGQGSRFWIELRKYEP
jgi:signal transduction histidine kinase